MAVVAAGGQVAPAVLHALPQGRPRHPEQATGLVRTLADTLYGRSRRLSRAIAASLGQDLGAHAGESRVKPWRMATMHETTGAEPGTSGRSHRVCRMTHPPVLWLMEGG